MKSVNTNPVHASSRARVRRITGQGLTEYIIVLALVAIASIVAVSYFGSTVKASFLSLGSDLVGGEAVNRVEVVQQNFDAAKQKASANVTLKDYNQ